MENKLYQLTNPQRSIWLTEQFYPNTNVNNIGGYVLIDEPIDTIALEKALNKYVECNEALHIRLKMENNIPMQYISDYSYLSISITELNNFKELEKWNQEIIDTPFSIIDSSLFSINIFKLPDGRGGFNATLHHLISDAWGMSLLINQVMDNYSKLIHNELVDYETPNYIEFINSENEYMISSKFEKDRKYWDTVFETTPELCSISDIKTINTDLSAIRKIYSLNSHLYNRIATFCKEYNCSVYTFLMSVYSIYLSKLNNIAEPIIGTPVLNRTNFKEKHTSGMFISTVPFKVTVQPDICFTDFLKEVSTTQMSIFRHQKYPYSRLLEDLKTKYNFTENLYEIALSYQNARDNKELCNVPYSSKWLFNGQISDTLDIHFYDMDNTGNLDIYYDYQISKLTQQEIEQLHNRIMNMIEQILTNTSISLANIQILTPDEIENLIHQFDNNSLEYPIEKSIMDLFEEQVLLNSDNLAIITSNSKMTYLELNNAVNRVATNLQHYGVKKGDIVATYLHRSPELIITMLAIMKCGAVYLPVSTSLPVDRVQYILDDGKVNFMITNLSADVSVFELLNKLKIEDLLIDINFSFTKIQSTLEDAVYTIYTSGSTGNPKGVQITNQNLNNFVHSFNAYFKYCISSEDICLATTNISFDVSMWEFFSTFLNGASLYLYDEDTITDIFYYCDTIIKNKITMLYIPPNILENVYNILEKQDDISINKILIGVEPIRNTTIQKFFNLNSNMQIVNGYGPTETTICTTAFVVEKGASPLSPIIPIGKPFYNMKAYILDKNLNFVPFGMPGELYVCGDNVGKGYLNNPILTDERYLKVPFDFKNRMYKTGDLVKFLPDGNIVFIGRNDKQVKVRGHRVELGEIESAILAFPNITKCTLVLKNDNTFMIAFYTATCTISSNDLRSFLSGKLPLYEIPNFFMQLDAFPLTANGKIDKKQLEQIELDLSSNYVAPSNLTEKKLITIWSNLLSAENIGIEDNFFYIGGDSLAAIKLVSEIYAEFNVKLTMKDIFEHNTIHNLSNFIQTLKVNTNTFLIEKAPSMNAYPVSTAQKRIYYTVSMEGENSITYNTPGIILFNKKPDIIKLQSCINTLINRHESFLTYFVVENSVLVQKIQNEINFELPVIQVAYENKNKIFEEFVQPFSLDTTPLIRFQLVHFDNNSYELYVDMHHIIADGESLNIFINELSQLYNGESLQEHTFDYKDYAFYENNQINSTDYKKTKDFWMEHLSGELPVLNMPTCFSRPSVQSFDGNSICSKILSGNKINEICKKLSITPYTFFLAAYYVLLYKYTNDEDIIVGTPVAGRTKHEFLSIIGMFVNTIAIRQKINSQLSFFEFLELVNQNCFDCFENQTYPFDELVKDLKISRNANRNPIFDTIFVYQNNGNPTIELDGLHCEYEFPDNHTSKFDFTFEIKPVNDLFDIRVEYCTKLFSNNFMEQFLVHYQFLIENILKDVNSSISTISMLSKEEITQIEKKFNDTDLYYDSSKPLVEIFEEQVYSNQNKTAIYFEGTAITYKYLNEMSNQFAHFLLSKKIGRNQIVGICLKRSPLLLVCMLGALKAGAGYMLIDPSLPYDRVLYMLENSKSPLLVTSLNIKEIDFTSKVIIEELHFENYSKQCPNVYTDNLDSFSVIYTSGSTGNPKGVELNRKGVLNMLINYKKLLYINDCENFLSISSVSFDMFIVENFIALLSGKTIFLTNEDEQKIPVYTNEIIAKNDIHFLLTTPSRIDLLLSNLKDNNNLRSLKVIQLGGEVFSSVLYEKISKYTSAHVFNGYGPSELTACCSSKEVTSNDISIGKPFYNTKIWICDKDMNICPIGVPGEMCVSGDGIANGYINNTELTNKSFVDNPFDEGKIYKTGDNAKYQENGEISYIGRKDFQIKIRGLRVELSEIEKQFILIPSIQNVAVLYKSEQNPYLVAFFAASLHVDISEIRNILARHLPLYMVPKYIVQLPQLPITPNGKVNKKELDTYSITIDNTSTYVKPETDMEKLFCSIWEKLLNVKIGIDDDIFEMGADSLIAIKFKTEMLAYHINISYPDIFQYKTIRELAGLHNVQQLSTLAEDDYTAVNKALENNTVSHFPVISKKLIKNTKNNILLLGGNGFIGSHILYDFIKNDEGIAYCIIRDKDNISAIQRFLDTLHFYFGNELDLMINKRIFVISSSITENNFGLDEKKYEELVSNITCVVNAAAMVKHYGSAEKFKLVNIDLTQNLIDFCLNYNKRLLHISSLSVSGNMSLDGSYTTRTSISEGTMNFTEQNLFIGQDLENLYIKSKFQSEKLILDNIEQNNLNAQILRLGNITNRYSDGKFQINATENAFFNRIISLINLSVIPNYLLPMYIEFTPVDSCATAIIKLLQNYMENFTVFHLYDNSHVYMDKFLENLHKNDISIKVVTQQEFQYEIEKISNNSGNKDALSGIVNDLSPEGTLDYQSNIHILSEFSRAFLYKIGFNWPEIDDSYLNKYITYLKFFNS